MNNDENNIQRLIGRLEAEDNRNTIMFKVLRIIFLLLVLLYFVQGVVHYVDDRNLFEALGYAAFVIAFSIAFLLMNKHVEIYSRVDYSLPTLKMLKQARLRYRIFPSRATGYIVALLSFVTIAQIFNAWDSVEDQIILIPIFFGSLVLGLLIGCAFWIIRDKPIYDKLNEMIRDLESDV